MTNETSRRRLLQIFAATSAAALLPLRAGAATDTLHHWQGSALGADATIALGGVSARDADNLFAACLTEVERLERVFSLQQPDSAISRLNAKGGLDRPPEDLLRVMTTARDIHDASAGAFDPTIQPLWLLFAETYGSRSQSRAPSKQELELARALVGLNAVSWDQRRIAFAKTRMALTLNGIAQGYITDRVVDLLRARGLKSALVNLGEYRAIGPHPEGRAWKVGIQDPKSASGLVDILELVDQAVSTSGGYGSRFGASAENHLIDPRSGKSAERYSSVSVRHASATIADGLSTAFSFMDEAAIREAAPRFGETRVLLVHPDQRLTRI
jgi:thiamine biosynthesis lipoprotein